MFIILRQNQFLHTLK